MESYTIEEVKKAYKGILLVSKMIAMGGVSGELMAQNQHKINQLEMDPKVKELYLTLLNEVQI